jgi:excinuclease ABC subunit C
MNFSQIKKAIPSTPGVYFFRDEQEAILYIGKAANLSRRISSYFAKNSGLSSAKQKMVERAHKITWIEADSEIDALLQEASYIKKHRPPYNVMLRDDKYYSFVEITKEPFPHIYVVNRPTLFTKDNKKISMASEFIGPFTNTAGVKSILRSLRKIFSYCTCKQHHARACQYAELRLCMGICCLRNYTPTSKERDLYYRHIRYIRNVLSGRQKQLIKNLNNEMQTASKERRFEDAKIARDQLHALSRIFAHSHIIKKDYGVENLKGTYELGMLLRQKTTPDRIEGFDISNIQGIFAVGSMVVFTNGIPDKKEYKHFRIKTVKGANDPAMMHEMLVRRFQHIEWQIPEVILIDGGPTQLTSAISAYKNSLLFTKHNSISIISLAKKEEELYIPQTKKPIPLKTVPASLLYLLQQIRNESHRFAISYYRHRHRKEL